MGLLIAQDPSSRKLMVLAPLKGSPAERAGLEPGDEVRPPPRPSASSSTHTSSDFSVALGLMLSSLGVGRQCVSLFAIEPHS